MLPSTKLKIPVRVSYNRDLKGVPDKQGMVAGDDLPALVRDAAKFAGVRLDDLFFRSVPHADGVVLEAWNGEMGGITARIGPMAGPAQPSMLPPERGVTWGVFWASVDLEVNEYRHLAQISGRSDPPPRRHKRDTDDAFAARVREYEAQQAAISKHCGWRVIEHMTHPRYWDAADLELVMARTLAHLPLAAADRVWSINLAQRAWRDKDRTAPRWSWVLEVGAFVYTVTLKLPLFPVAALVEWLAEQNAQIIQLKPNLQRLRVLADAPDPPVRTKPRARRDRDEDEVGFTPMVIQGGAR